VDGETGIVVSVDPSEHLSSVFVADVADVQRLGLHNPWLSECAGRVFVDTRTDEEIAAKDASDAEFQRALFSGGLFNV
jgi:hypothetical protein